MGEAATLVIDGGQYETVEVYDGLSVGAPLAAPLLLGRASLCPYKNILDRRETW